MNMIKPLGATLFAGAIAALLLSVIPEGIGFFEPTPRGATFSVEQDLAPESFKRDFDLEGLQSSGSLRILYQNKNDIAVQAPIGSPQFTTAQLFEDFASAMGLDPAFVKIPMGQDPLEALRHGYGDILAHPHTIDRGEPGILYSTPVAVTQELVIKRIQDELPGPAALAGKQIALTAGYHPDQNMSEAALHYLEERHGDMDLVVLPRDLSHHEMLRRLQSGTYDAVVVPKTVFATAQTDSLDIAFNLTSEYAQAWTIRASAPHLAEALDHYLIGQLSPGTKEHVWPPAPLSERTTLRILTRPSLETAFIRRGRVVGFEYDLLNAFAEKHNLALELVVPPTADLLIPWLKEGRGDLIANAMEIPAGQPEAGLTYTQSFRETSMVLLTQEGSSAKSELTELGDHSIGVLPGLWGAQPLKAMSAMEGLSLNLVAAPAKMAPEDLALSVVDGDLDYAIINKDVAEAVKHWKGGLAIGQPLRQTALGWATRREDTSLTQALDTFIQKNHRSQFYNIAHRRYFKSHRWVPTWIEKETALASLSPYDDLVRTFADKHGFDWRMIVAQMYQESRFNPRSRSERGARGLMQMLPTTAQELGVRELENPTDAIRGGVKYLSRMRRWIPQGVPFAQRSIFALAAYNVGYGHMVDARTLAKNLGLDPDMWFQNTENAMLRLSERRFAKRAKYGYCQGKQPVHYVSQIQSRFRAYVQLQRVIEDDTAFVDATTEP